MKKEECLRCKELIDLNKDLYVSLGTHEGNEVKQMAYFHFNCWQRHFEEKARQKALAVIEGMKERMMPIAKQLTKKLKVAIGQ